MTSRSAFEPVPCRMPRSGGVAVRLRCHHRTLVCKSWQVVCRSVHLVSHLEESSEMVWGRLPSWHVVATSLLHGGYSHQNGRGQLVLARFTPDMSTVEGSGWATRRNRDKAQTRASRANPPRRHGGGADESTPARANRRHGRRRQNQRQVGLLGGGQPSVSAFAYADHWCYGRWCRVLVGVQAITHRTY